jgi:hypothetical protein
MDDSCFLTYMQAMTRFHMVLALTFIVGSVAGGQSPSWPDVITGCFPLTVEDGAPFHPPAFADYTAKDDFRGRPAPVDLASHPLASRFRTRLREAAERGPNFAGHYTIASWGCGSGCLQHAIIDARNGRVFFPSQVQFVEVMRVVEPEGLSLEEVLRRYFRRDSALFVIIGRPLAGRPLDGKDEGIFYYRWTGSALRLVRFVRSDKKWCVDR